MKRIICLAFTLLFFVFCGAVSAGGPIINSYRFASGSGDYCSGTTWNTLSDFRLDFDHTTDTKDACLSSGTETGTLSTGATISTPATVSPGSGANALVADASPEYIAFDNTGPYFQSQYGELYFMVNLAGNNANDYYVLNIIQVPVEDRFKVFIAGTGHLTIIWEDNNNGTVSFEIPDSTYDFDAHYGDWAQVHVKWDTTRCTQGNGFCGDAGEDELGVQIRFDDNNDGDFADGGAEDWSAWYYETSTTDLGIWSAEPGTDDIHFGIAAGTYDQTIMVDDLEISYSKPTW